MICPNCNKEISSESRFCGFCGNPISQVQFCAMCGAKLQPGSKFCSLCGTPVGKYDGAIKEPPKQQNANADAIPSVVEAELQALEEEEKRLQEQMALLEQGEQDADALGEDLRKSAEKISQAQKLSVKKQEPPTIVESPRAQEKPQADPSITQSSTITAKPEKAPRKSKSLWIVLAAVLIIAVSAIVAVTVFGKGKEVKAVEGQIRAIGDVTLNARDEIEAAEKALDALDAKKAAKVENTAELYAARAAYDALYEADIAEKTEALEKVIDKIGTVTLESASAIRTARKLYDGSNTKVQNGISNYQVLVAAEESFDSLRAVEISQLIDAIGTVTMDSEETIRDVKNAYDDLTSTQKQKVTNYSVLEAAEDRLDELEEEQREKEKQAALAGLRTEYDKVEQTTWYYPSNYPYYIDTRCFVLPYAGKKDSGSAWLRMIINFTGDSWIFWTKVTFMIDGEKKTFTYDYSDVNRDNDTEVWEYVDILVNSSEKEFLEKIANSEETIVRFIGKDRQRDFTVSAGDKAAIKQMLTAFKYL